MVSVDLKFHWLGQSYKFGALPFGLSSAPRVFTKTLAPLVASLRLMSVQLYPYLDEILILWESSREVEHIGARFWVNLDRVYLPQSRIEGLLALVRSFAKVGQYVSVLSTST